jgi:hypothetical protein
MNESTVTGQAFNYEFKYREEKETQPLLDIEVYRELYAGRFSELSKVHGIEHISDSCPQEILRGIEKTTDQYS